MGVDTSAGLKCASHVGQSPSPMWSSRGAHLAAFQVLCMHACMHALHALSTTCQVEAFPRDKEIDWLVSPIYETQYASFHPQPWANA